MFYMLLHSTWWWVITSLQRLSQSTCMVIRFHPFLDLVQSLFLCLMLQLILRTTRQLPHLTKLDSHGHRASPMEELQFWTIWCGMTKARVAISLFRQSQLHHTQHRLLRQVTLTSSKFRVGTLSEWVYSRMKLLYLLHRFQANQQLHWPLQV